MLKLKGHQIDMSSNSLSTWVWTSRSSSRSSGHQIQRDISFRFVYLTAKRFCVLVAKIIGNLAAFCVWLVQVPANAKATCFTELSWADLSGLSSPWLWRPNDASARITPCPAIAPPALSNQFPRSQMLVRWITIQQQLHMMHPIGHSLPESLFV